MKRIFLHKKLIIAGICVILLIAGLSFIYQKKAKTEELIANNYNLNSKTTFLISEINISLTYPKEWGELRAYGQYSYQFYDKDNNRKSNFIDIRTLPPTPTIEYEPYLGDYVGDIAFSVENKKISLCTAINQKAIILGAIIKDCKEGTVNGLTFADFILMKEGNDERQRYNYQSRIYLTKNKTHPGLFVSLFDTETPNGYVDFLNSAQIILKTR